MIYYVYYFKILKEKRKKETQTGLEQFEGE